MAGGMSSSARSVDTKMMRRDRTLHESPAGLDGGRFGSASDGRAQAGPTVSDLMIMHPRVIDRDVQAEDLRRQPPNRGQQGVGRDDSVALRGYERHPRIHKLLLRIEDVKGGTLADPCFLAHAVERDFGGLHLGLRRLDIGLRRL